MFRWDGLRVLCLGGAGQVGREICRRLDARGVELVVVHDLTRARAQSAVERLSAERRGGASAALVASGGDLFQPAPIGAWEFVHAGDGVERVCVEREPEVTGDAAREALLAHRLGPLTPAVVRDALIWRLVREYRPQVVVDTINTATVLGYRGDLIQGGRNVAEHSRAALAAGSDPTALAGEARTGVFAAWRAAVDLTAHLDVACMIRYVQCLHALFRGAGELAAPGFARFVKVHTTGLGGMGFNLRYTHGDTGEPGLSTKLLGKVCAAGSFAQLLLSLAHTPGCDVRMVVPATLIGWEEAPDAVVRGDVQCWDTPDGAPRHEFGPLPLVDCDALVDCDGSTTLGEALCGAAGRVRETGAPLEVPYLDSGENNPYAAEDVTAITALGQMGCISREEVARAVLDCIEGDARYDVLTAIDAALLLPTQTAAVLRDRELKRCRSRRAAGGGPLLPSVSLGNLGPAATKELYEVEILRAVFETVEAVARDADEMELTLRASSFILGEGEGATLRRQILSLGIPVFVRRGPGHSGVLLGRQLRFPDPDDAAARAAPLDASDPRFRAWLDKGWVDLSGERMAVWKRRFAHVDRALREDRAVSRNWFDPAGPFHAGEFLAYEYSISGGQRKHYM